MARRFAAMGRDLALAARRTDRLDRLRDELTAAYPGIRVVTAALDVDDPDAVATVVPRLVEELGGLDRFIANAGIGKGAAFGTGKPWANRATLLTNVLGTQAQCEAALQIFRARDSGHLVLIGSVAGQRGMRGASTAYATSKAALNVMAEGLRSDLRRTPIAVTTIRPGFITTDINAGRRPPLAVDLDTGTRALVAAIEREPAVAYVPSFPWRPVAGLMRVLPHRVLSRFV